MRKIDEIVVHCSATPEGRHVTVNTIRKWHKQRDWRDIGYHYVIYLDGSIHKGRPVSQIGAHVKGRNARTIGVCYVGGVAKDGRTAKDTRTPAQKEALTKLLLRLMDEFPSINKISGHRDYAAKACPSFDATKEYRGLIGSKVAAVTPPQPLAAARPVETEMVLADADKAPLQSKTVLAAAASTAPSILGAMAGLTERVSIALIGVSVLIAAFLIYDRMRKARMAKRARELEAV